MRRFPPSFDRQVRSLAGRLSFGAPGRCIPNVASFERTFQPTLSCPPSPHCANHRSHSLFEPTKPLTELFPPCRPRCRLTVVPQMLTITTKSPSSTLSAHCSLTKLLVSTYMVVSVLILPLQEEIPQTSSQVQRCNANLGRTLQAGAGSKARYPTPPRAK
jgi:hypothetical protein